MASEPVLVDTSCWIQYFNRPGEDIANLVEDMIREDRAILTGVVVAELSQGARNEHELSELHEALGAVVWIETTRETYTRAGRLAFELRREGITVPTTDCIIAAASESVGGRILTLDTHFREIAGISSLTVLPEH